MGGGERGKEGGKRSPLGTVPLTQSLQKGTEELVMAVSRAAAGMRRGQTARMVPGHEREVKA